MMAQDQDIKMVYKQNDKFREYITKENWRKYPELTNLIRELQSEVIRG